MGSVVRMRGITRTFGETTVLHGIDLDIDGGETVAITGPSGSGKSTLLNLLGLLDRPTGGTYDLAEQDVGVLDDRARTLARAGYLAFVFQAFHLVPHLSVFENVVLPLRLRGDRVGAGDSAVHLIERVGLAHRIDARPATLSGGEKQRVAVARALVADPVLLLCDEPTGNLDTANGRAVLDLIAGEGAAAGHATVIVTHDEAVAAVASRRVHLVDGRVTA